MTAIVIQAMKDLLQITSRNMASIASCNRIVSICNSEVMKDWLKNKDDETGAYLADLLRKIYFYERIRQR